MNDSDRKFILNHLQASREALVNAVAGLSEELSRWKPAPDRWSALECVEHIATSEDGMFWLATQRARTGGSRADPERERKLIRAASDRSRKMVAPEPSRPSGRFQTLHDALAHFTQSRQRTLRFLESCGDDLRERTTRHPLAGEISCHECLMLLALHPARHAEQIEELKKSSGFPPA